jgi:hypothetical protein
VLEPAVEVEVTEEEEDAEGGENEGGEEQVEVKVSACVD